MFKKPVKQSYQMPKVSLDAGSFRKSYRDWFVNKNIIRGNGRAERELSNDRVDDRFWNDGTTRCVVNALVTNVIGKGLTPQSILPYKKLGISIETASELQDQIEWLWFQWSKTAHFRGQETFGRLQTLAFLSMIKYGEFLHLPIKQKNSGDKFDFKIQDLAPSRLRTPFDRYENPMFHDGVEVDQYGVPIAYWILNPKPIYTYIDYEGLTVDDFTRYPAKLKYGRKGVYHVFKCEEDEQYRGISPLAPVLNYLRNFADALDNELMCEVTASNFAVFVGLQNGAAAGLADELYKPNELHDTVEEAPKYYQDIQGGQIMYGNPGEKPEVIENCRPSTNFLSFCELLLRMVGACLELPYEVVTKDFSNVNYSSARAALLEAYRVYEIYREIMVRQYCQPIFQEVLIEAVGKKYLKLPCTPSQFIRDIDLWSNTKWIGPSRGYIDPMKEANACVTLINAGIVSRSEIVAERGGDFDEITQRLADEKKMRTDLGLEETLQEPQQFADADESDEKPRKPFRRNKK